MSLDASLFNALGSVFLDLEHRFKLSAGMGLNVYKHLAYRKMIYIDVSQPIDFAALARETIKLTA